LTTNNPPCALHKKGREREREKELIEPGEAELTDDFPPFCRLFKWVGREKKGKRALIDANQDKALSPAFFRGAPRDRISLSFIT